MSDQFRLHVDIPFPEDMDSEEVQVVANLYAQAIADACRNVNEIMKTSGVLNYRLGCDSDRQKSNHLDVDENGHVSCKKFSFSI